MSQFFFHGGHVFGEKVDAYSLTAVILAVLLPTIFIFYVHRVAPGAFRGFSLWAWLRRDRLRLWDKNDANYEKVLNAVLANLEQLRDMERKRKKSQSNN